MESVFKNAEKELENSQKKLEITKTLENFLERRHNTNMLQSVRAEKDFCAKLS